MNMLQIENENETPIASNYYQKYNNHFQNPDSTHKITDYTEQELKRSSSTNNRNNCCRCYLFQ